MRRIAFAGAAVLAIAIGVVAVIPRAGHKPDARSILIAAAQAAEEAETIHFVARGTTPTDDTPSGLRMAPGPINAWLSPRAFYVVYFSPSGELVVATALDVDNLKWWKYETEDKALYVADLTPIKREVGEAVAKVTRMFRSAILTAQWKEAVAGQLSDAKQSVTTETRGGREVATVTVTATLKTSPRRVTGRWVFEVDVASKHILSVQRYAQAEGALEELVGVLDKLEYDVPLPDAASVMNVPAGTKTVEATVSLVESASLLTLVMKVGDREIGHLDIQPEKP